MPLLTLDPNDHAPLYQQIARSLEASIREGRLQPGDKLPTVRDLAYDLRAASGTVKRAYDELCRRGLLVMTQGKGTFVARPETQDSRKERAMAAIDSMLDCMESLNFSPQEIQIFLDLKLRERMRDRGLRIAVIDDCPEGLRMLTERLYGLSQFSLYPVLLEDALADPAQLTGDMDLVVTTDKHYGQLAPFLKKHIPLVRLCMRPSDPCLMALTMLPQGCRVAVMAQSQTFYRLARELCQKYCPDVVVQGLLLPERLDILDRCDGLLAPAGFEQSCSPQVLDKVASFLARRPLVRLELEPDLGSLRTLEEVLRAQPAHGRYF